MRKFVLFGWALLALSTAAAFGQASQTREFLPLDRGLGYRFDYPVETHSVRTGNLQQLVDTDVVFGGLIAVEPNDSYLYSDGAQPTYQTRMRVLVDTSVVVSEDVDLASLAGTLPLIQYDASDLSIQATTLGGLPAARVDGIPVGLGANASEIIAYYDGLIYEIVIEPFPLGLGYSPDQQTVLDPVFEDILSSWDFVSIAG